MHADSGGGRAGAPDAAGAADASDAADAAATDGPAAAGAPRTPGAPGTPGAPVLRGRVWKFGDWISGDDGILRFSELRDFGDDHDPEDLARRCFAGLVPDFAARAAPGDIVVGGRGFGIPSHPPAPLALRAAGIAAVVVESTDSAFIRRSLNAGLPVVTCPGITAAVEDGDELGVGLAEGRVTCIGSGKVMTTKPFSPVMLDVLASGGLVPYLERCLAGGTRA
jgi:3-isopropylmalate/(R)-2-methylmalate dehydratase small subunit